MDDIYQELDRLFGEEAAPLDEAGYLLPLGELLAEQGPTMLFLAAGDGGVQAANDLGSGMELAAATQAAREVRLRLQSSESCLVETGFPGRPCWVFGMRLSPAPDAAILGGLLATEVNPETELQRNLVALRVGGRIARMALEERRASHILQTHLRHLHNEQDILKASHTDAAARAIEERESRLQEEHDRLVAEQISEASQAANRAKSQFLANMSHEIRTPLTAILGFTELLRTGDFSANPDERDEYLATIQTSGNHLLELINDILDLSKIEADRMTIERIAFSPHEMLAEVMSLMRVRAKEKGLRLTSAWPNGVPATIQSDPLRLKQLLMNLVGNAIKFTQHGGVQLVCRWLPSTVNPRLAIDVIDSGVGIAPDKLEAVFDAFVQADNSVTREFGGTGLGLAISRRIARALGGDIAVTSKPGEGSTFTVTIDPGPMDGVSILESPQADGVALPSAAGKASRVDLRAVRVLLVEDGSVNRKLISLMLRKAGMEVATAENGRIGVDLALAQEFDVILMDMQMPVLDGYGAAQELRAHGMATPIIALTAHAMSEDKQKCVLAGCSSHLSKPVKSEDLLRTIAEVMAIETADPSPAAAPAIRGPLMSTLPVEDPEFLEIVEEFVEFLAQQLDVMKSACSEGELTTIAEAAHALKGTAGGAGFDAFTQPAKELEIAARAGRQAELLPLIALMEQLSASIVVPKH